jgi:hypothetical protein
MGEAWRDLAKQLQALAVLRSYEGSAGNVSSGPRETGDEASLIGKGDPREHNRNCGGCLHCREGLRSSLSNDQIDFALN